MAIVKLSAAQLRRTSHPSAFSFANTAELVSQDGAGKHEAIIGQPRGVRAIEFGIGIRSHGYNVYVLGEVGTGLTGSIEQFLKAQAEQQAPPHDWVYVHNFAITHQPRAIRLPAGEGRRFKHRMSSLVAAIKKDLSEAFDTDAYRDASENIRSMYKEERDELLGRLRQSASADGMAIVDTPSGFVVVPIVAGKPVSANEYQQLPMEEQETLEKRRELWGDELDDVLRRMRELDEQAREEMDSLDREVAAAAIKHYFDQLHGRYDGHEGVVPYLRAMYDDVLDNLRDFFATAEDERESDLRRYEVNLLVDHAGQVGAPVVVELDPRYTNLLGRLEYEIQYGATSTHFTNIKAGSLHRANGGYLILNVQDVLGHRDAWEALKRAIKERKIRVQSPDKGDGNQVLAKSLDPEPIPLVVKIILLGNADYYYSLYNREEEFAQLFKVKAEFGRVMPRNEANELAYGLFIAGRCKAEGLRHFDNTAVAKIVEFGSRLAGHQNKLSARFEMMADALREASYWTGQNGREWVTAEDVQQALHERTLRSNLEQEISLEYMNDGTLYVATSDTAVGQVNGLSVVDVGDYVYGEAGRITANTYRGERGIINIDREVDLTGPIHHKGLLALTGYLSGAYAQERPLSLAASITFEQNYGGVEGDSASSAELYAVLSSLGNLPVKQSIAVTGAVNQQGEIQAIGAATEKIEGFFALCASRGLDGSHGVIIPAANVANLMLNDEVIAAVAEGRFHIWSITDVMEGMELLTGMDAGTADEDGDYPENTIQHLIFERLSQLSKEEDDEDEGDEGETA